MLLERPLGAAVLVSAARAAVRDRARQYVLQGYLAEREAAAARMAELNVSLEERVAERTAALTSAYDRLRAETAEREQAEAKLAQAQRMEALGQLAAGVAHDFNNVLHVVIGGLALIERQPDRVRAVEQRVRNILEAARRGANITGRLLVFARQGTLQAEAISPVRLLEGLREILAHTIGVDIAVRIAADDGLPQMLADRGQLQTVLVNLAVNARDAMPQGGTLFFGAASEVVAGTTAHPAGLRAGRYVRISVSDTGTGMSAATLARVGDPFFSTKAPGQGTGLGVAMARGFAHQSGGALAIESVPSQGTTVTMWLPQAEPGVPESEQRAPGEPLTSSARAPAHLLIVDDDDMVRETVADQMLEQGYIVEQAASGREALAKLDAGASVDLLISDFAMPVIDGLALIQAARRRRPRLRLATRCAARSLPARNLPGVDHWRTRCLNHRAEVSHQPIGRRER
ncbi:MAG: ATP-binding protein [Rhodopila sp.]